MENLGGKIATAAAEVAIGASLLSGSNPIKSPDNFVETNDPVTQEMPQEQTAFDDTNPEAQKEESVIAVDGADLSETPFTFINSSEPNIAEEEKSIEEEITKPATEQEINETLQEDIYGGEFVRFESELSLREFLPSVRELGEYEITEERLLPLDKREFRPNSNMIRVSILDTKYGGHPKGIITTSFINVDEFIDAFNDKRRLDFSYQESFPEMDELKGLGFQIYEVIKLKGPDGDILELGRRDIAGSPVLDVLLKYTDSEGKEYSLLSNQWENEDKGEYGYDTKYSEDFSRITYKYISILTQERDNYINSRPGIPLKNSGPEGSLHFGDGFLMNLLPIDKDLELGTIAATYDYGNRRELDKIAESNESLKSALLLIDAINSYPGNDVVDEEYLRNMYKSNQENFSFDRVQFDDSKGIGEKLTKYLLNYVNEDGDSWYNEFLKSIRNGRTAYYWGGEEALISDLNNLSAGVNVDGYYVQPLGVYNLVSNVMGIPNPNLTSQEVYNVSDLIPRDFYQTNLDFYPTNYGFIYNTYTKKNYVGDIYIAPSDGGLDLRGARVGQSALVFYISEESEDKMSRPWFLDVNVEGPNRAAISVYDFYRHRFYGYDYLIRSRSNHLKYMQFLEEDRK